MTTKEKIVVQQTHFHTPQSNGASFYIFFLPIHCIEVRAVRSPRLMTQAAKFLATSSSTAKSRLSAVLVTKLPYQKTSVKIVDRLPFKRFCVVHPVKTKTPLICFKTDGGVLVNSIFCYWVQTNSSIFSDSYPKRIGGLGGRDWFAPTGNPPPIQPADRKHPRKAASGPDVQPILKR